MVGIAFMMPVVKLKGKNMDISEFIKTAKPRAKRSILLPFENQILELKKLGYANWQICEWLKENDIKVSQEAVRKFIKSKDGKEASVSKTLTMPPDKLNEPEEPQAEAVILGSHKPEDLNAIIGSTPDLDALAKLGKASKRK